MSDTKHSAKAVPEEERFTAALSYVWILSLYTLLFKRDSAFVRFHAKQGVTLFILETLSFLFLFFMPVVIIICVIASIWGIKEALGGRHWTLPIIGDWLKKQKV